MALRDGDYEAADVRVDEAAQQIVIRRGDILVVCNLAETVATIRFDGEGVARLASAPAVDLRPGAVTVPPESVVIIEMNDAGHG